MTNFLVTGHTGFKGSWLTLLLDELGHQVSGLALDPEDPSLFSLCNLSEVVSQDIRGDIRDPKSVSRAMDITQPQVVVHLAAQPLVRHSFEHPRETLTTNLMGTFNLLEAAQSSRSIEAVLIVTTDKVYAPKPLGSKADEASALGGNDIYSASKAAADLVATAWSRSFTSFPLAIARGGNVIGGGDFGRDRLLPDAIAALERAEPIELRYPSAVRPWQHVLDCLSGYLAIVSHLQTRKSGDYGGEQWNVGPAADDFASVQHVVELASESWGAEVEWTVSKTPSVDETRWLALDSNRIERELGWRGRLNLQQAVEWTVQWHHSVHRGEDAQRVSRNQICRYLEDR